MSGGVGTTCDVLSPPSLQEEKLEPPNPKSSRKTFGGFLSFPQLKALAVMVALFASGMVSLEDLVVVIFSIIYIFFISHVAFPRTVYPSSNSPVFDRENKILLLYVSVGAILGLFLPIAYIFQGIFEGDQEDVKAAAPHVFLLASQVFMEGVAFSNRFSIPVRAFVPVFYNSWRIFSIMEWLRSEFSKGSLEEYGGSGKRFYVGRLLAVANMAFWSFNLFGFLVPIYIPKAFKQYYSGSKVKD